MLQVQECPELLLDNYKHRPSSVECMQGGTNNPACSMVLPAGNAACPSVNQHWFQQRVEPRNGRQHSPAGSGAL